MRKIFSGIFNHIKKFYWFLNRNFHFSSQSSKIATQGLLITGVLISIIIGAFIKIGLHPFVDPFLGILLVAIILFLSGAGVLLSYKLVNLLPRFFKAWGILLTGSLVIFFTILFEAKYGLPLGLLIVIVESLFFISLFWLFRGVYRTSSIMKKSWMFIGLFSGLFVNGYVIYWLQQLHLQMDNTNRRVNQMKLMM
ncbi:MAG: hypothetical protein ACLFPH_05425 [Bacteroidales bacterium]